MVVFFGRVADKGLRGKCFGLILLSSVLPLPLGEFLFLGNYRNAYVSVFRDFKQEVMCFSFLPSSLSFVPGSIVE